ncbi:hypothetical protein CAter282_4412 [Collimonas arenae]|uniref:Uncharacterized protein n=1 Tax=Collimonas arenae TaxID=279058 RepID=A0A127QPR8_9BURK|nr:hypothetical protein CAter10_4793 [Collimonas arenae]AMP12073.1 hypothetical protein CAter282_4412 [Collimonas arenae]
MDASEAGGWGGCDWAWWQQSHNNPVSAAEWRDDTLCDRSQPLQCTITPGTAPAAIP